MINTTRIKLTQDELDFILDLHDKWLNNSSSGVKAKLSNYNLDGLSFMNHNISYIDFTKSSLKRTNFCGIVCEDVCFNLSDLCFSDFSYSELHNITFNHADLSHASFYSATVKESEIENANCNNVDFAYCDLSGTSFTGSTLHFATMYKAELEYAFLSNATYNCTNFANTQIAHDFDDIRYDDHTFGLSLTCPEVGSFTAFSYGRYVKYACYNENRYYPNCIDNRLYVAKIEVPAYAIRKSCYINSRLCVCNQAKVLCTYDSNKKESEFGVLHPCKSTNLMMRPGNTVVSEQLDAYNGVGIRFYLTFYEAYMNTQAELFEDDLPF